MITLALAAVLLGCGSDQPQPEAELDVAEAVQQRGAGGPQSRPAIPAQVRAARILAVQQAAGRAYRFQPAAAGPGAFNPAQRWHVRVSRQSARIEPRRQGASWWLELTFAGLGRPGRITAPPVAGSPQAQTNRVVVAHGRGIEAWYLNGPLGLEHGLVLRERVAGEGLLELAYELAGSLEPRIDAAGTTIALDDAQGRTVLRYGELFARDADGAALAAQLELRGRVARLRIDDRHARYPLLVDPLAWEQQDKLVSGNPVGEGFGRSVAVAEDTAIVGAPHDIAQGGLPQAGAAYAFVRSAAVWSEQAKLVASDGAADDRFGRAVATEADGVLVGAPAAEDGLPATSPGAVYGFARSAAGWSEQQKLEPPNGDPDDRFGWAIALDGDVALISAPGDDDQGNAAGAVYVFARSAGLWAHQQKLTVNAVMLFGASLGGSVALAGDMAVLGAPVAFPWFGCSFFQGPGAAYVFHRSAATFHPVQELVSPSQDNEGFGSAVALAGDTAFVGAPCRDDGVVEGVGAVYRYVRSGATWLEQSPPLTAAYHSDGAAFGIAIAATGDTALIGANGAEHVGPSGAAYVFTRDGTSWTEADKLGASDGVPGDDFGAAVALCGDTALIGAWAVHSMLGGSAYVFRHGLDPGSSCTTDDECASGYCASEVCCEAACDRPCEGCAVDEPGDCELLPAGAVGDESCGYRCDGVSSDCPLSCGEDEDCVPSHVCELGECVPRILGAPCTEGIQCATGHCVDGVCCDLACSEPCVTCLASAQDDGVDGRCGPATEGTDPRDACAAAEDPTTCGADGLCDGQGRCRDQASAGSACEPGVCYGPLLVHSICDEAGECVRQSTEDCSPYQCAEPGECPDSCGSNADCASGLICDWSSRCVPPPAASDGHGGCGCRTVRPAGRLGWGAVGLLGLIWLVAKGRRRAAGRRPTRQTSGRRR